MNTKFYLAIGACLFLLGSCISDLQEKTTVIPQQGELVKVTAYVDDTPMTKTGLVDKEGGGKSVVWKSGNSISLFFNSGNNGGNEFTTSTNGPKADFLGTISAVSGDLSGVGGQAYFWGLYPYNVSASCDGTFITTVLPESQLAYQGDVADDLLVTVGRSENLAIHFKNTCSVIGFTLTQENIKKVVFSGNAGEPVAGEFKISFDDNNKVVDNPTENAVESISITPAETSTFENGVTYYFATLPGTFSGGYSLSFIKEDGGEATYTRESSCTFKASTFYTMANKDEGLTFTNGQGTNPTEIITFADSDIKTALVNEFDTDGDGELSKGEAAAVTSLTGVFGNSKDYKSFDEFQYFTSITAIPDGMFSRWALLTSIVIPNSVTSIGHSAFYGCTGLTSVVIPNSVTSIGNYAFEGSSGLTSFVIPNSVTSIGVKAFHGCTGLTSVVISNSVTSIGDHAFEGCTCLNSIVIPNSVKNIGHHSFVGCTGLTSVVIPNSVYSIGLYAFSQCTRLTSIVIPGSVTSIDSRAFYHCIGLTSVTVLSETPPQLSKEYVFYYYNQNIYPHEQQLDIAIYVPKNSVDAYKSASNWSDYADRIQVIPE